MATYVDQPFYGWPHEELPHQDDSQEVSASQMLDHGSISFGRFACESLSWEKRSVFTYNKCQEELEKFKSPGLVAKKKVYFEEYYKRIRAMKALQESQQTEITLDYGGDGSISSQAGEEDETAVQLEDLGGRVAEEATVHSEEVPIAASVEEGTDRNNAFDVQVEHSDPEMMLPDSHNNIDAHAHGDMTIRSDEMQHMDIDTSVHESATHGIEDPKQHDLNDLHNIGIFMENCISVKNTEPEIASGEKPLCPVNSKEGDTAVKPAHKNVPRKDLPAVRKYRDKVPVPKLKEPPSCARKASKLEDKTKPNIQKPSHGRERLFQKTTVRSENGFGSRKATADKVSRNNKSSIVASCRPLKEVHSNVTTPRPFSIATDRRAAVTSDNREGAVKLTSKSSSPRPFSAVKGKDAINVQGPSRRTVISNGTESRGLENRRVHEKKRPVTSENRTTSHKARDANVIVPVKARSVNLTPQNKFSSNSVTDIRFKDGFRNDRREEGRHEARVIESRRSDAKISTPSAGKLKTASKVLTPPASKIRTDTSTPLAAKRRTETKQMPSFMNSCPSGRRPQFGEQSLEGKKLRQDKPRWR